jgi:hypothetical protein
VPAFAGQDGEGIELRAVDRAGVDRPSRRLRLAAKASPTFEPQTRGERTAAFEYRVMLDIPDVVGTPADLSAPPADVSENDALEAPETLGRHPPAPPAALEEQGASGVRKAFSSAPMLTTPSNEKKDARTRSGPTEGLAVVAAGSEDFEAIRRIRGDRKIIVGKSGNITVTIAELEQARSVALEAKFQSRTAA